MCDCLSRVQEALARKKEYLLCTFRGEARPVFIARKGNEITEGKTRLYPDFCPWCGRRYAEADEKTIREENDKYR